MPIRSFSTFLLLLLAIHAPRAEVSIEEIAARSAELRETAAGQKIEPPKPSAAAQELARTIGEKTAEHALKTLVPERADPQRDEILVFVSWSMGEETLRTVFREVAIYDNVHVYFRGIRTHTLMEALRELHAILKGIEPTPNVSIDPRPFREENVAVVPYVQWKKDGQTLATVRGLVNIEWLQKEIDAGRSGDLGVYGTTVEIAETDLITEMQRRAAQIPWAELKEKAVANFWKKKRFYELPPAPRDRVREVDPTVVVTSDITIPDGRVVAAAGTQINPLELMPFHGKVIVFDGTDAEQVEQAIEWKKKAGEWQRVTLIATAIDREQGWDALSRLQEKVGDAVYLLTPELVSRFELEHVPALIEANGRVFVVIEAKPKSFGGEK